MGKVRKLSEREFMHLLRIAAGLLERTNGNVIEALTRAMVSHRHLLASIRHDEIRSDLGPGDVVLFVPDDGGLALRLERHPVSEPTEEVPYPEVDLLGFEVIESASSHQSKPTYDAGTLDEDWYD